MDEIRLPEFPAFWSQGNNIKFQYNFIRRKDGAGHSPALGQFNIQSISEYVPIWISIVMGRATAETLTLPHISDHGYMTLYRRRCVRTTSAYLYTLLYLLYCYCPNNLHFPMDGGLNPGVNMLDNYSHFCSHNDAFLSTFTRFHKHQPLF
jgi:hypothetical protein